MANEKKREILKSATGGFKDAGKTLPNFDSPVRSKRPEKIYPTLYFDIKALPEIKDWKVGETYDLAVRVKQVSYEKSSNESNNREEARFEVHGVKSI